MFHDDMIFKAVQNAFSEFFNEKIIKSGNSLEYRSLVKVSKYGKYGEVRGKDVKNLFK